MSCEKEEITRYLDGYEYCMLATWVSLRGELELADASVDALGVLRERLPGALRAFALGRLSIDTAAPPRYVPVTLHPTCRRSRGTTARRPRQARSCRASAAP